jgi:CRISPR system Cascade subunit CasE
MMYLSRITLSDRPDLQQLARYATADAYGEHQMLWRLFEPHPEAQRDFLYRRVLSHGRPRYFLLSHRAPVADLGLWHIDPPKPFAPRLNIGARLAFMLRANPVVTRKDEGGRPHRHDVVMDLKNQVGYRKKAPHEREPLAILAQQAGTAWLATRAERHGFSVRPGQVHIEGYQQREVRKRTGEHSIRYSTLDFEGLLTVTDPEVFTRTLCQGLGHAKAFGCGMMLVRRA